LTSSLRKHSGQQPRASSEPGQGTGPSPARCGRSPGRFQGAAGHSRRVRPRTTGTKRRPRPGATRRPGLARRADRRGGRRLLAGAGGPGPADRPRSRGTGHPGCRRARAGQGEDPPAHHGGPGADHQARAARTRHYRETTSTRATRTRRTARTRGCRPGPRVYGLAAPVFPPPCVLRGRGRIFPAPARGTPHPEFERSQRARYVPDRPVSGGNSRSLPESPAYRLTCVKAG